MVSNAPSLLDRLSGLRLVLVTGKGGVGKSTLTATLGSCLAAAGRRTLLLDVDPRESLYQLLDVPPSGGDTVRVQPRLWVRNLRPGDELDDVVRERVPIAMLARRVLASPIYRQFAETAPGLEELAVLGHALRLVRGMERDTPAPDVVILDAPASGHGLSLLAGPGLVSDVIRGGPFGEMAGELATFVADESQCGVVLVTQAEELPVTETLETIEALRTQLNRRPEWIAVNGLYPPFPEGRDEPSDLDGTTPLGLWRSRARTNDRESRRLAREWSGPILPLPLTPQPRGRELIRVLAQRLEPQLRSAEVPCR